MTGAIPFDFSHQHLDRARGRVSRVSVRRVQGVQRLRLAHVDVPRTASCTIVRLRVRDAVWSVRG